MGRGPSVRSWVGTTRRRHGDEGVVRAVEARVRLGMGGRAARTRFRGHDKKGMQALRLKLQA